MQKYNLINSLGFLVTLDIRKISFTSVQIPFEYNWFDIIKYPLIEGKKKWKGKLVSYKSAKQSFCSFGFSSIQFILLCPGHPFILVSKTESVHISPLLHF